MSIIIAILILSYLGFDFTSQAFAESPQEKSESPQTKVVIPPSSTTSESKKMSWLCAQLPKYASF